MNISITDIISEHPANKFYLSKNNIKYFHYIQNESLNPSPFPWQTWTCWTPVSVPPDWYTACTTVPLWRYVSSSGHWWGWLRSTTAPESAHTLQLGGICWTPEYRYFNADNASRINIRMHALQKVICFYLSTASTIVFRGSVSWYCKKLWLEHNAYVSAFFGKTTVSLKLLASSSWFMNIQEHRRRSVSTWT